MGAQDALDAIGQLPDDEIDVAQAALQFARIDLPGADMDEAEAHLAEIAQHMVAAARSRVGGWHWPGRRTSRCRRHSRAGPSAPR